MASGNEYLNMIPIFDGNKESCSINNFFYKFEAVAKHLKWTSDEKVFFVKLRMQGAAGNYVHGINSKDYTVLKNSLIEQFSEKNDSDIMQLCALASLAQPPNMPVEKFIEKVESLSLMIASKQSLNSDYFESFRSKIEQDVLLSKMNPQILQGVRQRNPQTLKQIKEFAILEEKKLNSSKNNQETESLSSTTPEKEERGGTIESLNMKLRELEAQVTVLTDKVYYLERLLNPT